MIADGVLGVCGVTDGGAAGGCAANAIHGPQEMEIMRKTVGRR